jgi:Uma2 family endonuclease
MSSTVETAPITAEEYGRMRVDGPSELVDGRIVKKMPSGKMAGLIAGHIHVLLGMHVYPRRLGRVVANDTGYRLRTDPDRVRVPDVSFVADERVRGYVQAESTFFPGPPDLAVEVVSPNDKWFEVAEKVDDYLAAGAKAVWVVSEVDRRVYVYAPGGEVHVLGEKDEIDGGEAVPGFKARVADLFAIA